MNSLRNGSAHCDDQVTDTNNSEDELSVNQWLTIIKQAALEIDPKTAEVMWSYEQTLDPYGLYPDLREEYWQVGRMYFARDPAVDIWVWFGDLPDDIRTQLLEMHQAKLAFPAGPVGDDDFWASIFDDDDVR